MAKAGAVFIDDGETKLIQLLKEFGEKVAKKPLARALKESGSIIEAAAQRAAPYKTGATFFAIKLSVKRSRRRPPAAIITIGEGQYKGETYYAAFVELGHKQGKRGGLLSGRTRKKIAGTGWLRASYDRNEDRAAKRFAKVLDKGIAQTWKTGGSLRGLKKEIG